MSGIVIGIACEMLATAIGQGTRTAVLSQIEAMGSNLVTISAGTYSYKKLFGRKVQTTRAVTLKEADAEAIENECSFVNRAVPAQQQMAFVKYKNSATNTTIIGTTPDFPAMRNYQVEAGRFFYDEENFLSLRVAVIGQKITAALFKGVEPVGNVIQISGIPFRIIAVLKPKGISYDGTDEDNVIFIPLHTALRRVFNINYIGYIYVQAAQRDKMNAVEKEIENLLRDRHSLNLLGKKDDFTIQNIYTTLKVANETNASLTNLVGVIAAVSLVVGGAGILAVTLLSVKERTTEIGLRMAVGATPGNVLLQFFLEATALSSAGGIAGIIAGLGGIYLLKAFAAISAIASAESVAISVAESVAIGVLFGSLPARKASRVQPVKALRGW
ncbi:MAG: ABC transporter permease [Bacteroidota bacterium]|nr:ABC transporter permease [Bacteroidota bacterium]